MSISQLLQKQFPVFRTPVALRFFSKQQELPQKLFVPLQAKFDIDSINSKSYQALISSILTLFPSTIMGIKHLPPISLKSPNSLFHILMESKVLPKTKKNPHPRSALILFGLHTCYPLAVRTDKTIFVLSGEFEMVPKSYYQNKIDGLMHAKYPACDLGYVEKSYSCNLIYESFYAVCLGQDYGSTTYAAAIGRLVTIFSQSCRVRLVASFVGEVLDSREDYRILSDDLIEFIRCWGNVSIQVHNCETLFHIGGVGYELDAIKKLYSLLNSTKHLRSLPPPKPIPGYVGKRFGRPKGFTAYAERRIVEAVAQGENIAALNIGIGWKGLKEELDRFKDNMEFTKLKTNQEPVDPDVVYSQVPYEKGFQFLWRIEREIGRPAFDEFLKKYIATFKFKSIDTDMFLEFLKANVPGIGEKIDLHLWTEGTGIPPDRNHFGNPDQQMVFKAEADSQDAEIKGSDVAKRNQFVDRTQQMVFKAEAALQDAGIISSDVAKRCHFVRPNPQMVFKAEADAQDAEIKGSDVAKSVPAKKRAAGGLNKVCGATPELQVIVGQPALPRTEIVKQLWAYIRRNNLQDPSNKRKIICDEPLRAVFEIDCTDMFQMNKLLSKHIIRLEPPKQEEESNQAKKLKVESVDGGLPTGNGEPGPILVMSEALAHFFGTGERELSKAEVLKRIWAYIMDPTNKNVILCDPKLQQLLGCESISTWEVAGMMDHHLFE